MTFHQCTTEEFALQPDIEHYRRLFAIIKIERPLDEKPTRTKPLKRQPYPVAFRVVER